MSHAPPPRDPRMERHVTPPPARWAVVVVPDDPRAASAEVRLTAHQLARWRNLVVALSAMVLLLVAALGVSLPRTWAYPGLVDENMALKANLRAIDRRLEEVDRMMLRLRLYDAQLRSLSEPTGDHGPLPDSAFANSRILGAYEEVIEDEPLDEMVDSVEDELGPAPTFTLVPSDLRPAEAWAFAVQTRTDTFLSLFETAEPSLTALMADLEELHALEAALPSVWPAEGELSSGFGYRKSPITGTWKFHAGVDIADKRGTPIYAAAAGKVLRAEMTSGYGRMVELDHGYGITTIYGHCTTLRVREGDEVSKGQYIATMGSTGQSTGPHLHFELRLDGIPVDPLRHLPR